MTAIRNMWGLKIKKYLIVSLKISCMRFPLNKIKAGIFNNRGKNKKIIKISPVFTVALIISRQNYMIKYKQSFRHGLARVKQ